MNEAITILNAAAETWLSWILENGMQAALVATVLLLVVKLGWRWPSTLRYGIAAVALLKFLVPPLISLPVGLSGYVSLDSVTLPATAELPSPIALTAEPATTDGSGGGFVEVNQLAPHRIETAEAVVAPIERELVESPQSSQAAEFVAPDNTASSKLTWQATLLLLQIVGTGTVLLYVAVQVLRLRSTVANASPCEESKMQATFEHCAALLGLRRRVRLLLSSDVDSPISFGVLTPTILLPATAPMLEGRDLEAALLHELTHVRRRDAAMNWIAILTCAVWWFHPLAWLTARNLRRLCEDCCDDAVLLAGSVPSSSYCESLLRLASQCGDVRISPVVAQGLHPLGHRILRMMDERVRRSARLSFGNAVLVLAAAGLLLPGATLQSQETPSEAVESPPPVEAPVIAPGPRGRRTPSIGAEGDNRQKAITGVPIGLPGPPSLEQPRPLSELQRSSEDSKKDEAEEDSVWLPVEDLIADAAPTRYFSERPDGGSLEYQKAHQRVRDALDSPVSLSFQNASLEEVVKELTVKMGVNIHVELGESQNAATDLAAPVTATAVKEPLGEFLARIFPNHVCFADGEVLRITTKERIGRQTVSIRGVFPWRQQLARLAKQWRVSSQRVQGIARIVDFELQRREFSVQEVAGEGEKFRILKGGDWTAVSLQPLIGLLDASSTFETDPVDPVFHNDAITCPIPGAFKTWDRTLVTHPRLSNPHLFTLERSQQGKRSSFVPTETSVILFRYFDVDVKAGKHYQYRVRLKFGRVVGGFAKAVSAQVTAVLEGDSAWTPWSEPTEPVPISEQPLRKAMADGVDFAGEWLMTPPSGEEQTIKVEGLGGGRYRIGSGIYEWRDEKLVAIDPDDKQGFEWKILNSNVLLLVREPETSKTGESYLNATLTRMGSKD